MKKYEHPLVFQCQAENEEHAREQCLDAEYDSGRSVREVDETPASQPDSGGGFWSLNIDSDDSGSSDSGSGGF